jgi:CSLREA domain-containing protein
VNRSLPALLIPLLIIFGLQPFTLAAQEETTPEAVATETAAPTEEVTPAPTAEITDEPTVEPTLETTLEPTADVTVQPTAELTLEPTSEATGEPTLQPSAPPAFNLTQTTFDAQAGVPLEISLTVSDEAGIVRVVEDASATLGGVSMSITEPTESAAPFNTGVSVTYLAPSDFSGIDSFSLNAIDAAGETASMTISVNVVHTETIAIPEDGVMVVTTFTVNSNNDVNDDACDAAHCSLREAINAANANSGFTDTIAFSIGTGVQTIQPSSVLPQITDPVIIDGTTQPGFAGTPIIGLDGTNAGSSTSTHGLNITAGDSLVRGLVIYSFSGNGIHLAGDGTVIEGNYLGTNIAGTASSANRYGIQILSANNTIGGTTASARNLISGNFLSGIFINGASATGNQIQGNYIGLNAAGTSALPNEASGIVIGSADVNFIGGTAAGAGNIISGNAQRGISLNNADSNQIQGNYIGVNAAGTAALPGQDYGVSIDASSNNLIGGTSAAARNIISGNTQNGIVIANLETSGNLVQGNYIGLNAAGTTSIPNGQNGVLVDSGAINNTIGGTEAGAGNLISGNSSHGVQVISDSAVGNRILGNSIYGNSALGINLGLDSVTANDAGDGDIGPNNRQNFPVLTTAFIDPDSIAISGTLNTTATTNLRLEFFVNDSCDAAGNGEGQTYLGFADFSSDGSGNVSFTVTFDTVITWGKFITATATGATSGTSEFSGCVRAIDPTAITVNTISSISDAQGCDLTHCSLREAVTLSNATAGTQKIVFNIASGGPANIRLNGKLTFTDTVIVDGTTQPGYDDVPLIEISPLNSAAANDHAFVIQGEASTIRGLAINGFYFGTGISIQGGQNHLIEDNYIGVDPVTFFGEGNDAGIVVNYFGIPLHNNVIRDNFIAANYASGIAFEANSDNNLIQGNILLANFSSITIGSNSQDNIIEGNLISRNAGNGIHIQQSPGGNIIRGNYIGTDGSGASARSNTAHGIFLDNTSNNIIGGTNGVTPDVGCQGDCNLISGNTNGGIYIVGANNQVLGNFIGSNATGTAAIGNGNQNPGIMVIGSGNIIGGTTPAGRNIISGNRFAVTLNGANNVFQGNYVGVQANGSAALKNEAGIVIQGNNNLIGGSAAGTGNIIAWNDNNGVTVQGGLNNRILSNTIYGHANLGVNLNYSGNAVNGVNPNDPGDADTGANNGQNYPALNLALNINGTLHISGTLNSEANKTYRIEFFANDACDPSGYGEGQRYLGFIETTTDAIGNAVIVTTFPLPTGPVISATATDPDGNTSEFSACRTITLPQPITRGPVLVAPLNRAFTNDNTPTLSWNSAANAMSYEIQVSTSNTFTSPVFTASGASTTQTPATALTDGIYYWRARGVNNLGNGPWSAVFSFTIDTLPPGAAPTLTRPADGSFTADKTPAFSWARFTGAKKYQLVISLNPDCSSPLYASPVLTTTAFTLPNANALPSEDVYFWCVRADDMAGNWGPYSPAFDFQLTLLKLPLNGSSTSDPTPSFTWNPVPGTNITYNLLISTSPDMSNAISITGLTTPRYTPLTALATNEVYYWRVIPSAWSVSDPVIWSFLINPLRLTAPVLTSPVSGSFTNDSTPLIDWNPVSAVSGVNITYEVWIDDASSFSSPQTSDDPISDSQYEIDPALPDTPGKRYYLKVRAVYDGVVFGPWSSTRSFTLDTVAPTNPPNLTAPADDSTATSNRPTFTWGAVTGATRYALYLDDGVNPPVTIFYNGSARSYRPAVGLPAGTYFWQVIAYDAAGNASPTSDVRSLTIP